MKLKVRYKLYIFLLVTRKSFENVARAVNKVSFFLFQLCSIQHHTSVSSDEQAKGESVICSLDDDHEGLSDTIVL